MNIKASGPITLEKNAAEFFAGIGLVRLGLEKKGWEIIFANDFDKKKFEIYGHNFPNTPKDFHLEDIHRLTASDIPTVTLATASFPCNDLSLAGYYQGLSGKNSSAVWGFVSLLETMGIRRPPMVMLENVPSLLNSHQGKDLETLLLALNSIGYLCDIFILDALYFVPQSRARLFIIGLQNQMEDFKHPFFSTSEVRPKKLTDFIVHHPNINWNIRALPSPPSPSTTLRDIIENIPHDSNEWWDQNRKAYLKNQMSERHHTIANAMIQADDYSYGTIFRRVRKGRSMAELRTDGIAGCLRTPRGGSGRQILFKAGKGEYHARLLTPRECARLQGVPDTYKINVPLNQALFGFGDAVCVPVIEWIAEHYLNPVWESLRTTHQISQDLFSTTTKMKVLSE